jgi:hypothetical protein
MHSNFSEGVDWVKLLNCDFPDTNRVFSLLGDGRKILGANRMPGCTSVEISLIFA